MLRSILIAGGGTAGWLCACYLAKTLNSRAPGGVRIALVESPDIGIIGVGEGTFPSIRGALSQIGISESRFIRETQATFKQGIRFVDWVRPAGSPGRNHYFHPFNLPSSRVDGLDLVPYWLLGEAGEGVAFADAVTLQKAVADAGCAPKRRHDGDYEGPMNYAYHFDAMKVAALLAEEGRALGVSHHRANICDVTLDERGALSGVVTRELGTLHADLYVDCTGMRAALIGKALGQSFESVSDALFVDRAVAIQVPHERPDTPIASHTISTAHEAGWTWDIGLQERRGIGYVYSSRHTSDDRAEAVLRDYIGPAAQGLNARRLPFETGYRPVQWKHNCVAIGLSAGFLEPLEATGIGLIEMGTYLLAHLLPMDAQFERAAAHFNRMMSERYARIVDFLKLHYCLTQRRDSAFWIDNADPASIPESLRDRLAEWHLRPPHRLDFVTDLEMFMPASWQFILYGMEFRTNLHEQRARFPRAEEARREFAMLRAVSQHAIKDLRAHRRLIEDMCGASSPRLATA
ncbi:MAG: tryptophan halogenase family protein [Dokdonella sp.]|nr:tryptophan 7-halogenase [Dokdonella sp.]MCB1570140.1 tryptophan 7-halogenase [Xanthomonadales bacterium]MCB1573160.1 tryptophan 7-halogenase [Xanthomonadales bacterium]MCB1576071.1 tryptophan 7-halogenase [Xanthomonadales bacterium]